MLFVSTNGLNNVLLSMISILLQVGCYRKLGGVDMCGISIAIFSLPTVYVFVKDKL